MGQCQIKQEVKNLQRRVSVVSARLQANSNSSLNYSFQDLTTIEKYQVARDRKEYESQKELMLDFVDDIIDKGEPFTDKDFQPTLDSLYPFQSEMPHYCKDLSWRRASEIFKDGHYLFGPQISPNDILQGKLGSCYLLSALASMAEDPKQIENLFYKKKINKAGIYLIFFYINGYKQGVIVDDYLPAKKDGILAFSASKKPEIWVSLVEKAWAKLLGCYKRADGGSASDAANHLTGCPTYLVNHKENSSEELWKRICSGIQCKFKIISQSKDENTKSDIIEGHAYSLLKVCDFQHLGKRVRLVQLRNPWGNTEWTGEWSDNSPQWTPELDKEFNHVNENDGTFFIPLENFRVQFQETHFCASGQADRIEIHKIFINYNTKTHKQAFIRFTVEEAFTLSDDLFVGISTNQQGRRLDRQYLEGNQKFIPAMMNFMLFDPNGEFMDGNLTQCLNGCLLIHGKQLHFAKGNYLLMFDPIFPEKCHQNSAYKRIQFSFWFPKGKSFNYEKVEYQDGMPLFMNGMEKIARQSQVEKVYYLEHGDLQDQAFAKQSLGLQESTQCLYTFLITELTKEAPRILKQSIILQYKGIQCFHKDKDKNGEVIETDGRTKIDCELRPGECHLIIGRRFKDNGKCDFQSNIIER